jgi:hypothetical protein
LEWPLDWRRKEFPLMDSVGFLQMGHRPMEQGQHWDSVPMGQQLMDSLQMDLLPPGWSRWKEFQTDPPLLEWRQ